MLLTPLTFRLRFFLYPCLFTYTSLRNGKHMSDTDMRLRFSNKHKALLPMARCQGPHVRPPMPRLVAYWGQPKMDLNLARLQPHSTAIGWTFVSSQFWKYLKPQLDLLLLDCPQTAHTRQSELQLCESCPAPKLEAVVAASQAMSRRDRNTVCSQQDR